MNQLKHRRNSSPLPLSVLLLAPFFTPLAFTPSIAQGRTETKTVATGTQENEVQVTLLGQPCFLKGPFDKDTLKAIHSIGPAQIPEISVNQLPATKERFQKALETVRSARGIPPLLDSYREKLGRRLEAQTEVLKALIRFKQNRNVQEVVKIASNYLPEEKLRTFQSILRKKTYPLSLSIEELLETYNEGIEADPEQEFHRTINQKMHIQYACSFDESPESSE